MKKISNILLLQINKKVMLIFSSLFLAVVLFPIYRLACFATPFYDDFNYAISVKYIWETNHNIGDVIREAVAVVKGTYFSWQGTYGSIFLMALMPGTFGIEFYRYGIWAVITMLAIGIFVFVYILVRKVAKASVIDGVIAGELIAGILIELIYSAQQGIFWYNGAVHYSFAHGVMLLLSALVICFLFIEKTARKLAILPAIMVLSVFVAGTNFVSALQGLLIFGLFAVVGIVLKKKNTWLLFIPITMYVAGMIVSVTAPGNANRQILYEGVARAPLEAILLSFKSAFMNLGKFTGWGMVGFSLLLVPTFIDILNRKDFTFDFKLPGIVTLLSFCMYATGFTPSWYGIGEEGLARTLCAVKITFLLLFFVNEFYWLGWIKKKHCSTGKTYSNTAFYGVCVLLVLIAFSVTKDKAGSFSTYGSYYYVHTGEANNYYNEQLQRIETIVNGGPVVELKPLVWKPWFLCKKNELSNNPDSEQNQAAARWYGKSAIYVAE